VQAYDWPEEAGYVPVHETEASIMFENVAAAFRKFYNDSFRTTIVDPSIYDPIGRGEDNKLFAYTSLVTGVITPEGARVMRSLAPHSDKEHSVSYVHAGNVYSWGQYHALAMRDGLDDVGLSKHDPPRQHEIAHESRIGMWLFARHVGKARGMKNVSSYGERYLSILYGVTKNVTLYDVNPMRGLPMSSFFLPDYTGPRGVVAAAKQYVVRLGHLFKEVKAPEDWSETWAYYHGRIYQHDLPVEYVSEHSDELLHTSRLRRGTDWKYFLECFIIKRDARKHDNATSQGVMLYAGCQDAFHTWKDVIRGGMIMTWPCAEAYRLMRNFAREDIKWRYDNIRVVTQIDSHQYVDYVAHAEELLDIEGVNAMALCDLLNTHRRDLQSRMWQVVYVRPTKLIVRYGRVDAFNLRFTVPWAVSLSLRHSQTDDVRFGMRRAYLMEFPGTAPDPSGKSDGILDNAHIGKETYSGRVNVSGHMINILMAQQYGPPTVFGWLGLLRQNLEEASGKSKLAGTDLQPFREHGSADHGELWHEQVDWISSVLVFGRMSDSILPAGISEFIESKIISLYDRYGGGRAREAW
jgi:hypothetical protein